MIFADFLEQLRTVIRKEAFYEFAILVIFYKKALNEIGWEKLRETKLKDGKLFDETLVTRKYCAENNGEFAPEICNEFAADLL